MQGFPRILGSHAGNATELSSYTSEASLIQGLNKQLSIPTTVWQDCAAATGSNQKKLRLRAHGTMNTTGTPTFVVKVRLSTSFSLTDVAGTLVAISPTITSQSGVTDGTMWDLDLDLTMTAYGQGSNTLTLSASGWLKSFGGFAAPYVYAMHPSAAPTTTWTAATFDASQTYWVQITSTCGTSNASNKMMLKKMWLEECN